MPQEIDLLSVPAGNTNWLTPEKEGTGLSDYGKAATAGAYGLAGSVGAGVDYLLDSDPDAGAHRLRRWADEGTKSQIMSMSESARDALNAGVLPGGDKSIWDADVSLANALGLKVANATPSILSSIIPGGIIGAAGRGVLGAAGAAGAGTAAAGGINALAMGGQVFDEIEKGVLGAKEEDLRNGSELYRYLRDQNFSDTVARKVLVEAAAGNKPLLAGMVGAATEQFGAAAIAARTGAGAAERGILSGARRGAVEEAGTEAVQNTVQEGLTQAGNIEAGTQKGVDVRKLVENTVQGAVVGGLMGGGVGAASGAIGRRSATPKQEGQADTDPVTEGAAGSDVLTAPVPEVTTPRERARQDMKALDKSLEDADPGNAVAEAIQSTPTVTPEKEIAQRAINPEPEVAARLEPTSQDQFVPQDEYEVDPDYEPGQPAQDTTVVADVAPGQATEGQELPVTPPEQTAAGDPSEATQTGGQEIDLLSMDTGAANVPELPSEVTTPAQEKLTGAAPRVLQSNTKIEGERRGRMSAAEAARIADGQGDAVTLSHNPDDWSSRTDRDTVRLLLKAFENKAAKDGTPLPQWAQDMVDTRGKTRGNSPTSRTAQAKYMEARRALSDLTLERQNAGVARRETKDEAKSRILKEKRVGDAQQMKALLDEVPLSKAASSGLLPAIKKHAEAITNVAKRLGIEAPVGTTDPHLIYLREASEIARGSVNKERAWEFVANDFFIRNGAEQELIDRRRAQAQKVDASYDEVARGPTQGEAREGTDDSELYEQAGASEAFAAPEETSDRGVEREDTVPVAGPARTDAISVETSEEPSGVAGSNRAGQFKVESRGRRRVQEIARRAINPQPTEAQREAGNYKKEHRKVLGYDVSIENKKGSTRTGRAPDGKEWSNVQPADYGYIRRTEGADGDHVDVYVGPHADQFRYKQSGEVYVVNQQDPATGKFDEHKVMLGWNKYDEAIAAYKAAYGRTGKSRIQSVARFNQAEFKLWLENGDLKKPADDAIAQMEASDRAAEQMEAEYRNNLTRIMQERNVALKGKDFEEAGPIAVEYADKVVNEMKRASAVIGMRIADQIRRETARQNSATAEMAPAAREADISDIEAFFRDEPEAPLPGEGNTLTSPRSGVQVKVEATQSLGSVLANIDHKEAAGASAIINPLAARQLQKLVADVPVHFVIQTNLDKLAGDWAGTKGLPTSILGYYEPLTHEIILSSDFLDANGDAAASHLLIHEGMHAAVMRTINENASARSLVEDAMAQVRAAVPDISDRSSKNYQYGMTNAHEFISELFSSRSFQDLLASIPARENYKALPIRNIWQMMLYNVRKWLGLSAATNTMLDSSLRVGAAIVDLSVSNGTYGPSTPRAMAQPAALTQDGIREGLEGLKDAGGAGASRIKRIAVRASTLDQLRQNFSGLFPDGNGGSHFDRVVRAIQRMQPFVSAQREAGQQFAEEFANLMWTNPKVAEESAKIRSEATIANLNLLAGKPTQEQMEKANRHHYGEAKGSDKSSAWQAKAVHGPLQARFSALPEAVQRQILKEAAYYRKMQNDISAKLVQNILDFFAPDMAKTGREDIARKALAGRLEEEDREALGNNAFFNALKSARELKTLQGMYFPLMRHGDFIVRTTDVVGDVMGGKVIRPGVVEFRGTDKIARRASKAFAEKTDMVVTRTAKRYYDPATGEAIKAADADAASEVAYEVSVQTEGFHTFDTGAQANRFRREALRDGTYREVSDVQMKEGLEQQGDLTGSQLSALVSSIRQQDHIPEAQRKMMETAIAQAAVRLMSGNRIQKKSLPRRKVEGYSNEYARNALSYATSASNYLGKLEYMPGIRASIAAMDEQVRGPNRFADKNGERSLLFDELKLRVDSNESGIKQPSSVVRDLMAVTMLSKLFSPAHSIINAMQPAMVSYPVMAGEHGAASTVLELTKAFRESGAFPTYGTGVANTIRATRQWNRITLDTTDVLGAMRKRFNKAMDGSALARLFDELVSRGAMDDKAQFEMAQSMAAGRGVGGTALAKMDRIFRQGPAAVEAVNRATTAVAAFRLARRKGMSEEQARDYAFDTVMKTQGDYSPANASPYFNNPIARPFLQFKKYGQMMTHLYMDMIYRSFKGATKADRMEAMKQFGHLVTVQTLMAGALSVPGFELVKYVSMLGGLLGIGGGAEGMERRIKRALDEAVGETWSSMVRKGIVSRAIGVDLSSRMSMADMWTFGEPKKYNGSGVLAWTAEQYFGASGGTLSGYVDGIQAIHDGDYLKFAEKVLPIKAGADIAKAATGLQKGDYSPIGAAVKASGFKTASEADYQERRSERFSQQREAKEKRNALRKRYLDAATAGQRVKIKTEIMAYNRTVEGQYKLSIPSMDRMREEDRKERMR